MSENAQDVEKRKPAARALVSNEVRGRRRSEARFTALARRKTAARIGQDEAEKFGKKDRLFFCGKRLQGNEFVAISTHSSESGDRRASFSGVAQCGDVWRCPVCSTVIKAHRADEIQDGLAAWRARGGHVAMLTVTVRHHMGDDLGTVYGAMSAAWRYMTSTRAYKRLRDELGVVGYVRATEVTYGRHGWHPHWHFLFFVKDQLTAERAEAAQAELLGLWRKAVDKHGGKLPNDHGVDLRAVEDGDGAVAEYLTKMRGGDAGAVLEVSGAVNKVGRGEGSLTPFQLLDLVKLGGEDAAHARALWVSYCDAMRGKRSIFWTPGLRGDLGLGVELSDEEVVETADHGTVEVVMAGRMHDGLRRDDHDGHALDLAERKAWDDLAALCRASAAAWYRRPDGSAVLVLADDEPSLDRLATLAAAAEAAQAERDAVPLLTQWERDAYRRVGVEMGLVFGEVVPSRLTVKGDH